MKTWVLVLILIVLISSAAEANIPPTRNGIKRNLPVYLRAGVITQEQADAVLGDIYQGNIEDTTIPKGTRATNYFVVRKTGRLSSVSSWVAKYDRKARVVGGLTWLAPCDNLIILPKKPQPKVVVKKEKVVESTLDVMCSEERVQPAQSCPVSQRVSLAPIQYSPHARPHLDVRNSQAPFGAWWKTRERVIERIPPKPPPPEEVCPGIDTPTPPAGNAPVFPQYPKVESKWWDPSPSNANVADRVN